MPRPLLALLAAVALLSSRGAWCAETTQRFYGYAYDLKTNAYLYTEVHAQRFDGDRWLGGSIAYYGADGKRIGYKTLDFSKDPFIPLYSFDLPLEGYHEGISHVDAKSVTLEKTAKTGEAPKSEVVTRPDPSAADSGFHNLLVSRFADLQAGQKLAFTFIAAGNLDHYKFSAQKTGEETWQGIAAVHFRVEPNSLLKLVAPALELTYDPATKQLLEYRGISNVHDLNTGKPYVARIAYYKTPPADAPKALPPLE